ncbi:methyltransferase type 11 [Reticulibacter mediterranei]|uniref:Methyltransferase type 11 n=1 Tax=Reticulibacter mediterranei TaxID=2778369 RepID=A0A8J3IW21_9CHLR|nr:class I SAM-dependent methyltransferase [Reticulibacter mediterranei]GHO96351.1 methyltransferase type 11 [Reticulibacter mediterranei]
MQATTKQQKGYKGIAMEGIIARWYTQIRSSGNQSEDRKKQAENLTNGLPEGAAVLEVAPGPGYFAIEMARLNQFHVTGLDISHTFVEIATENARQMGVNVDFQQGDAANMPFDEDSFDLIICQAAFKNFSYPGKAINEMHRVLRSGGTAIIQDMWKDTSNATIRDEVALMRLNPLNAFMTRKALESLRRRAYTREQFEHLAAASAFGECTIVTSGLGIEVRLKKQ